MGFSPFTNYYQPFGQLQAQPQAVPAPVPTVNQVGQGLVWVQGETGAKSYLMPPNSTALLMDSENEIFYIKVTDSAGMPTLRAFDYKERTQTLPLASDSCPNSNSNISSEQFVTREEYAAICGKYDELKAELEALQKKPTRKKEVSESE